MNKTLFLSPNSDQDPADQPQPEARMREALGLRTDGTRVAPAPGHRPDRLLDHGAGSPRRHRFVQEGEVPVEVMTLRDHGARNGGPSRFRVDETALAAERLAREQAERAFAEATERLRELQTKLGHAELARDEALALAAERLAQIEALRAQEREAALAPAIAPTPRVAAAPKTATPKTAAPKTAAPKPPKVVTPKSATPRPRGRPKAPQPVKWWIKKAPAAD